ncbi:MAG TPA: hypothetical protein VMQ54_07765, partial [Steroidobacteraceae bacterium]|nr:hypothetical protein [Steroidobacteraceae bacterium]
MLSSETELMTAIRELAFDRTRRTSMARLQRPPSSSTLRAAQARAAQARKTLDAARGRTPRLTLDDPLPSPVKWQVVKTAETRLGFPLPSLLGRLWTEIGNALPSP